MTHYTFKTALAIALAASIPLSGNPAFAHGNGEFPRIVPYRTDLIRSDASAFPNAVPNEQFVNFETPHVYPLDLLGDVLAAVNTADNHLEIFDVSTGLPRHVRSIPVGFDPVSCRFNPFSPNEVWVVNHVSDSISIVDLNVDSVVRTIRTLDEPADVVFTTYQRSEFGAQPVAAVSCSSVDTIQVFALTDSVEFDPYDEVERIHLAGEDPRALAVGAGGDVFAAIFESGNATSLVPFFEGIEDEAPGWQAITHENSPYGGQTPPYNNVANPDLWNDWGTAWVTPHGQRNKLNIVDLPPPTGVIIRRDTQGAWRDDNGKDWTFWVSGNGAERTGRAIGWSMLDNDIARIPATAAATEPAYVTRLMNAVMAIGVNPGNGDVVVVGTEATNEIRFEPNLTGTFTRVMAAVVDSTGMTAKALVDLNAEHLAAAQGGEAYASPSVPQAEREKSIGDPRGVAFDPDGDRIYVTGMGSNNLVVLDGLGQRLATGHAIAVGQGPTGIVYDAARDRLYVLNKFEGSIATVDASTPGSETVLATTPFFDPTPVDIKRGRPHFYDTHRNSGLGQVSCASCHIDGRMDRLAWDLGDPIGAMKTVSSFGLFEGRAGAHNLFEPFGFIEPFDDFHFMKGPMTTQTLQDIIGMEPHHWRGDRDGIEEFAGAWPALQGADAPLDTVSMQEFEDFLATLAFGPNPFRALDNTLPGGPNLFGEDNPVLPLPGHYSSGKFDQALGDPLPDGDAWRGLMRYIGGGLDSGAHCVDCHTLPTGAASTHFTSDTIFQPGRLQNFLEIPPGPNGEAHLALFALDGTGENAFKTPQLRNQMDKEGLYMNLPGRVSRSGFGLLHDGSLAGLAQFISSDAFSMIDDQDVADMVAFNLGINGDFGAILAAMNTNTMPGPPGPATQSAHAAVGRQITVRAPAGQANGPTASELEELARLVVLSDGGWIDLVASGIRNGTPRSFLHATGIGDAAIFDADAEGQTVTHGQLLAGTGPGTELTYTAVPAGLGHRYGLDRDLDGVLNGTERAFGTDTGNALDHLFVDWSAADGGTGRPAAPLQTIESGAALVTPSPGKKGYLRVRAGNYGETVTLDRKMTVVAEDGVVRIGGG